MFQRFKLHLFKLEKLMSLKYIPKYVLRYIIDCAQKHKVRYIFKNDSSTISYSVKYKAGRLPKFLKITTEKVHM